jgi:hypothetical protein
MRRVGALLAAVMATLAVWIGVPLYTATGLALDHPAWSKPGSGTGGPPLVDRTSYWPPGRRYEWIDVRTGLRRSAVDPWGSSSIGWYVWTLVVAMFLALVLRAILRPRQLRMEHGASVAVG